MKDYLVSRLRESSTWRGLVMLATAAGVVLSAAQTEALIALGMAVAGAIAVFLPDSPKA